MQKRSIYKRKFWDWRYIPEEKRRAYNWALILFGSLLMFFFFQRFVVNVSIIQETSMLPTLRHGEYYLVNKYIYHLTSPHRGEIVVLREIKYASDSYVKRVIGLGGETLMIRHGGVFINGRPLAESYAAGKTHPDLGPMVIEKDHYFVMGDNRSESYDSRDFGAVSIKQIDGKIDPSKWFPFR